jgi:hypothetical protein
MPSGRDSYPFERGPLLFQLCASVAVRVIILAAIQAIALSQDFR